MKDDRVWEELGTSPTMSERIVLTEVVEYFNTRLMNEHMCLPLPLPLNILQKILDSALRENVSR